MLLVLLPFALAAEADAPRVWVGAGVVGMAGTGSLPAEPRAPADAPAP